MKIEMWPIDKLVPYENNPRRITDAAVGKVAQSIRSFGFRQCVVVDEAGVILVGHTRTLAAKSLGLAEVPVHVAGDLTPELARAYRLADNRTNEESEWDYDLLKGELNGLHDDDFDLELTGFDPDEVQKLLAGMDLPSNDNGVTVGSLVNRFGVPPFSVLDARQGYWQQRKRGWLALGIKSEIGRGDGLLGFESLAEKFGQRGGTDSNTSVFDPVVCELAYRWFCPVGGVVLDPFAGGSVRGIVAAKLGRQYVGIDLRAEQVEENRKQWEFIGGRSMGAPSRPLLTSPNQAPVLETIEGIVVVRDDLLPGGTKRRLFARLLKKWTADILVYASPAYGYAQTALAMACRDAGKRAVIFVAERKEMHRRTAAARAAGADIQQVPFGRINVVEARAREFCEATPGAMQVPFGAEGKDAVAAIADIARSTGANPGEVWCVAGSGVLTRGLQMAWPQAKHHAVQIGTDRLDAGDAQVHKAPEAFEDNAMVRPPFPSCSNYDAKAWAFIKQHATPGALFWNVAADEALAERIAPGAPLWHAGDSRECCAIAPGQYDFLFTCPPYADLEKYSDNPADLSTMAYRDFLTAYRRIIHHACGMLKQDTFACIVVGEVRGEDGNYYGFVPDTIAAFRDAGLELYNEAILVTSVGSLPLRVGRQFQVGRKLGKTHQNILVFVKGDARAATDAIGLVDFGEIRPERPATGAAE